MRKESRSVPVGLLIGLGLTAKFFVDTTSQIYMPFLPVIAAGLGVSVLTMGRMVSAQSFAGLIAPLTGHLADRIGHKTVIRYGLFLCGAGMFFIVFDFGPLGALVGMVLNGVGIAAFTPGLHAYLSDRLPYEKRARGLGITEFSWALAGIIGLFLAGHLIEGLSWNAPLFILGAGFVAFGLIYGVLPGSHVAPESGHRRRGPAEAPKVPIAEKLRGFFELGTHRVSAWSAIVVMGLHVFAISNVMIIHGEWLKTEYGLGAAKLGNVALIFGVGDWIASIVVALFVDRIGKRRAVLIGLLGSLIGYAMLPALNRSLVLVLVGFMVPRVFFEFGMVSSFPLLSEQHPAKRGKVLSLSMAAGFVGRTLSGLTGPTLYLRASHWALAGLSFAATSLAFVAVLVLVKDHPYRQDSVA